jgi:hypothetical protein
MRLPILFALLITALVSGCAGSGAARHATDMGAEGFRCSPTVPPARHGPPPVPFSAADFDYGNKLLRADVPARGRLIAGTLPNGGEMASIERNGSISAKVGWWRGLPGKLVISGQRLDRPAAPLKSWLPDPNSYGATGFIPSDLTFPTTGCWRVSGKLGRAHLSFVLSVTKTHQ